MMVSRSSRKLAIDRTARCFIAIMVANLIVVLAAT